MIKPSSKVLADQPSNFFCEAEAMDVSADGSAVGVHHLLTRNFLLLDADARRSQWADPYEVFNDVVVGSSCGREVLR